MHDNIEFLKTSQKIKGRPWSCNVMYFKKQHYTMLSFFGANNLVHVMHIDYHYSCTFHLRNQKQTTLVYSTVNVECVHVHAVCSFGYVLV